MPHTVKVLGVASLLNDIASEMIFPLLPTFIVTVLGGSRTSLGLIEGAADSLASLLKLAAGHWSDRAGQRRRFVLFGYTLTALLRPCLGLTTSAWQVGLVRLADRFGKGVRTAPRDALIADATSAEQRGRAFGFHRAMDHAGAAIGPLVASVFLWSWPGELRLLFELSLLPGLALLALLWFGLRETAAPQPTETHEPLRLALQPFDVRFRGFLIALVIFTLGNSSDMFLLMRADELGVPTVWLPMLWCTFHILKSVGNWRLGQWVDQWGPRRLIVAGWLLYAVVYLLFALATEAWQAWALFWLYAGFYALTEPSEKTLVANLVGPERRGLAFGWFNFAIGIATLPASVLFGVLYDHFGRLAAFGTGAGLALMASIVLLRTTRSREH
ncbi:MAG TPA: MFS transporter [Planctomycetaceae bacterium]|nr:MFS transporter [Planctomycetaceae bacterium]